MPSASVTHGPSCLHAHFCQWLCGSRVHPCCGTWEDNMVKWVLFYGVSQLYVQWTEMAAVGKTSLFKCASPDPVNTGGERGPGRCQMEGVEVPWVHAWTTSLRSWALQGISGQLLAARAEWVFLETVSSRSQDGGLQKTSQTPKLISVFSGAAGETGLWEGCRCKIKPRQLPIAAEGSQAMLCKRFLLRRVAYFIS